MRWKLFATLAEAADDSEVTVTVDRTDPTLRDAFDELLADYPQLEEHILTEDGSLAEHVRLLCDGTDPFHAGEGWETCLEENAELALFPPVTGG